MRALDKQTLRLLRDPRRRWWWIRTQLSEAGRTLADVARGAGVTRECVTRAKWNPYPRMERVLAEALDVPVQQLFPDRYDEDGRSNRLMGRPPKLPPNLNTVPRENSTRRNGRNVCRGEGA